MINDSSKSGNSNAGIDSREALFNRGDVGPIKQVQVSTERICSLRGILYDLDADFFRTSGLLPKVPSDPTEFYAAVVRPMLNRHPALSKAEVRNSGRGVHVILRFDKPVAFETAGDRERWAGIVEVVQEALPVDPDAPGLTATTRAIGGINGKNGAEVTLLAEGEPVTSDEVLELYDEMIEAPFRTVMRIMVGDVVMEPCPCCGKAGTKLSALDYVGRCYGSCGNVKIERLYDLLLAPRDAGKEVVADV